MTERALSLLKDAWARPLRLVDVGARWGIGPRWQAIADMAEMRCFEPDAEECVRLNAQAPATTRYLPIGLSHDSEPRTLYVTREPACSSIYPPLSEIHDRFPCLGIIAPVAETAVACRALDAVLAEDGFDDVVAIKIDTQGSELDILRGGTRTLAGCALVEVEVEFNPLYAGQPLFCDVDRFLRDQGFVLWRLENLVHYAPRAVPAGDSAFFLAGDPQPTTFTTAPAGQLFWAQAIYVPVRYPVTGDSTLDADDALRGALLVALYGFWDLSLDLLRRGGLNDLLGRVEGALGMRASESAGPIAEIV